MAVFEVLNNQQSYFNRYFRRNIGDDDYATIPEVTLAGDFVIECSVLASLSGGSVFYGLLGSEISTAAERAYSLVLKDDGQVLFIFGNGAAFQPVGTVAGVVETNKLTTIRVTRIGNLIKIYVNGIESASSTVSGFPANPTNRIYSYIGGSYLSGIMANLKITDNGTLIHNWPINSNANTEADLVSGAIMTIINGNASDWGLFDKQDNGDWKGSGLIVPPWDSVDQVLVTA